MFLQFAASWGFAGFKLNGAGTDARHELASGVGKKQVVGGGEPTGVGGTNLHGVSFKGIAKHNLLIL